jgi:hypothetical protein
MTCTFVANAEKTVTYDSYIETPRFNSPDLKHSQLESNTVGVSAFMSVFDDGLRIMAPHRHVCDWIDPVSEKIIDHPRERHTVRDLPRPPSPLDLGIWWFRHLTYCGHHAARRFGESILV